MPRSPGNDLILGKIGTGKSKFLENLIRQDINRNDWPLKLRPSEPIDEIVVKIAVRVQKEHAAFAL